MIDINGSLQTWDVQLPVKITLDEYLPITIDGFQIEEWQGQQVDTQWVFDTKVPFYQWKHQATHQGWLFYQNIK